MPWFVLLVPALLLAGLGFWLYRRVADRALEPVKDESTGGSQSHSGRNEPGELPRIAQTLATLRGMPLEVLAAATSANARAALPGLA